MMSNLALTCQVSLRSYCYSHVTWQHSLPYFYALWFRPPPPPSFFYIIFHITYEWTCPDWSASASLGWLVSLSRFIYPLYMHDFFILFFCLSLSLFLFVCVRICVCVCKWVSMHWRMEANTHTCRDNIKKNETQKKERHPFIHSFIHCLFSSLTSVKMMVVIFFFWSRIEIEKEKIGEEEVFMPSAFYASTHACTLACVL